MCNISIHHVHYDNIAWPTNAYQHSAVRTLTKLCDCGPQLPQHFVLLYLQTHTLYVTLTEIMDTSWKNMEPTPTHQHNLTPIRACTPPSLMSAPPLSSGALWLREWCGWMCIITTWQTGSQPTREACAFSLVHFPRACLIIPVKIYPILWYYITLLLHVYTYVFYQDGQLEQ